MVSHRKQIISILLTVWLGFSPQLIQANTTPVSAPASPAQPAAALLGADTSTDSSLKVQLSDIRGEVSVQKQGASDFSPVSQNTDLAMGDTIKTANGSCRISIDGRSQLTLQAQATLRITEALRNPQTNLDSTKLTLQNGKLLVKLPKLKQGSTFEVNTPTAVAVVRGTVFYLNVGIFQGIDNTQMYVDESNGGVLFKNIIKGSEVLVPAFSLSNAFNDGRLDEPRQLTPEQKEAFLKNFETDSGTGASQQFGIEEIPAGASSAALPPPGLEQLITEALSENIDLDQFNDAKLDKEIDKSIPQLNTPDVLLPPIGGPGPTVVPEPEDNTPKPGPDTNPPPKDDTQTPPDEDTETPPDEEEEVPPVVIPEPPVITDQDKRMVLEEVNSILAAQGFDFVDANQAIVQDAQTGKVFTDVHGNRVRTDQYIFHQSESVENFSGSSVTMYSITQRAGDYQNGISAFIFSTLLSRALTDSDGPIRDLPWNDWMNVVTDEELTNVRLLDGSNLQDSTGLQLDQFIVHEHISDAVNGPSLYPMAVAAVFTNGQQPSAANPIVGSVSFLEFYTDPFLVDADQGRFWIQASMFELTSIEPSNGENVAMIDFGGQQFAGINGETVDFFDRDGAQTVGFASHAKVADLDTEDGINFFRESSVHPAFFEQQYGDNRFLYGAFLPINDQGQVIDQPGFALHGLRDLVHPNPLVNGGNYNLEVLLVYGIGGPDSFQEQFRIDTIITPEIFSDFGLKGPSGSVDRSAIFPASLDDDFQNI